MTIKNILSIAAFSSAFVASTAFAGLFVDKSQPQSIIISAPSYNSEPTKCFKKMEKSATAKKISALLAQDERNMGEHDKKWSGVGGGYVSPFTNPSFDSYAQSIAEYADRSGSIADDGTPAEFQNVWRVHIKAWRIYAKFLESTNESSTRNGLDEKSFKTLDTALNTQISHSWNEVLRVADEYGANMK